MNKTIIEQLRELPKDLGANKHTLLTNFVEESTELTNKYNLSIHSWSNDGAWIKNEITKEDVCYDFCWDSDSNKYKYEIDLEDE